MQTAINLLCQPPAPMGPCPAAGTIVAGDNFGRVHFLDHRMAAPIACVPLHRKNGKVGKGCHAAAANGGSFRGCGCLAGLGFLIAAALPCRPS